MRNPLNKRIPRDLKKNCLKYIGMMIILICTISIGSSFQATLNGATEYLERIKDENYQEDGFFEVDAPMEEDIVSQLEKDGLWVEENFYATEHNFPDSSKVLIFNERTAMDLPELFSGNMPQKENEIAIDHVFARNREIEIGDSIELLGKKYQVCGTVSLPDYSSLFMNNTDLTMNTNHFCVSVLTKEGFEKQEKDTITYRYSYRYTDRDLTKKEKLAREEETAKYLLQNGVAVNNMLSREKNQSISFLEMDIGTDGPFMTVFVYLLIAMIAFIFAILTNNTIESESVIIGTLRALGFKKKEIIWHYLQPTLIVAVVGSLLGNLIGYTLMIQPFIDIYYTTYSIGPLDIQFDPGTFLITTILPVVIMLCINSFSLANKLSLSPLRFLRHELKKGRDRKAVKLPNFSFISRFRLRVIIQNRGSYVMLFLGIFLASFLLMFGIGLEPLLNHYTDEIDKSLPYNYQYLLKAPAEVSDGEKLLVYEMDTWFALGQKDMEISFYGIDEDGDYFRDAYVEHDIAVSSALANKMNLQVGDTMEFKDKAKEKEYTFTVAKIYPYDAMMTVFLKRAELARLMDADASAYNCIVSDNKLDLDAACIAKTISREDLLGASSQMMDSFESVIQFINIFSVVVYLVIIYIMTKVVIEKNTIPISYMKVFGYQAKEIRKLYLTATTLVVFTSLIVCIPLEVWLFKKVLIFLSSLIDGYIAFYLPTRVYLEIVIIGVAAYLFINALHVSSVKKIPMTEALKNRE
ncbi:MAG: FtsX-like permease family protein [bacterium]|nr:FtsX-like permease family protein [bacterium]